MAAPRFAVRPVITGPDWIDAEDWVRDPRIGTFVYASTAAEARDWCRRAGYRVMSPAKLLVDHVDVYGDDVRTWHVPVRP